MLGKRIRLRRKEINLSLQELAEKTELTPGFLSQIERGLAEPSISSLRRIAKVLDTAMFYFLIDEEDVSPVVRKHERRTISFPEIPMVYELLCPNINHQMEMFLSRMAPGAKSCETPMPHPGEEIAYVLQGTMKIRLDQTEHILNEGDTIYYLGSTPHQIINIGDNELVVISTITPPMF